MESLEAERERAVDLDVSELADAIESIGFEALHAFTTGRAVKSTSRRDRMAFDRAVPG
jgi:hypothetical protein